MESGIFPKNVREVAWAAVSETTGPVLSVLVFFGKSEGKGQTVPESATELGKAPSKK